MNIFAGRDGAHNIIIFIRAFAQLIKCRNSPVVADFKMERRERRGKFGLRDAACIKTGIFNFKPRRQQISYNQILDCCRTLDFPAYNIAFPLFEYLLCIEIAFLRINDALN